MLILKKIIFALPFLIFLAWFFYSVNFFYKDIYLIFSFNPSILLQLLTLIVSLTLSSLFFIIFASLASDWKFILPVSLVGSLLPIALLPAPASLILWIGTFLSLNLTYFILTRKLKTYLTFQANALLTPSIKTLAGLLILISSLAFYLSASREIKTNGFKIPDSLLDTALKFAAPQSGSVGPAVQGIKIAQVNLTPEQIELLRKNPDLLKQFNIDPKTLDQLEKSSPSSKTTKSSSSPLSPQSPSNESIKALIQSQVQNFIKPYQKLIPVFLAVLFFISLNSIFAFLSIVLPILVALTFYIFEKTGFIHFEVETREVKKLVV